MLTVDLVYDSDCPNVVLARSNLMRAFSKAGIAARWQEHRIGDPASEARVRGFGSPTILVDGRDVVGAEPGAELCCRVYAAGDATEGAPSVADIAAALSSAASADTITMEQARVPRSLGRWRPMLAALPGVGIALMPKMICPLCWPAYAGLLSATGLTFLMDDKWLMPVCAVLLLAALCALAWNARARRGYGPMLAGIAATVVVLAGRFALNSYVAIYGGVVALVAASIWNAWPRRAAAPRCSACVN